MRIDQDNDVQDFAFAATIVALAAGVIMCYILG